MGVAGEWGNCPEYARGTDVAFSPSKVLVCLLKRLHAVLQKALEPVTRSDML